MIPQGGVPRQTVTDSLLGMPGPFQMLSPGVLLMLGIGAIGLGTCLAALSVMNARVGNSELTMAPRVRYTIALSFAGTAMGGVRYYPLLSELYGYLSFGILLLLPAVICALIIQQLVRAEI